MAMQPFGCQIHLKRFHINGNNLKHFQTLLSIQTQCHALEALRVAHQFIFLTLYDQKTSVKQQQRKKRASVSGEIMGAEIISNINAQIFPWMVKKRVFLKAVFLIYLSTLSAGDQPLCNMTNAYDRWYSGLRELQ